MPSLDNNFCLERTSQITKTLRSRNLPLPQLIHSAEKLHSSPSLLPPNNSFFPRRNEWLLEWIVQRLKEDDDAPGYQARTTPGTWKFLNRLFESVGPADVACTLKRHGIVGTVARLMMELQIDQHESNVDFGFVSTEGSLFETNVVEVLDSVSDVLSCLEAMFQKGSMMALTKAPIETIAGMMGDFFKICQKLLSADFSIKEQWVDTVIELWRNSIWGFSNPSRISTVWAAKCLHPATNLLMMSNTPLFLVDFIEEMISEYIYSSEILHQLNLSQNASPATFSTDLVALLVTIKSPELKMAKAGPFTPSLILLRVAIKSLSKSQKSKPSPTQVDLLFQSLLYAVDGLEITSKIPKTQSTNIASMLNVVSSMQMSLSLTTLSQIVHATANLTSEITKDIQWPIVEQALRNDFDVFVHTSNSKLASQLFSAICRSEKQNTFIDELNSILVLLVQGFAKARDLLGFVHYWKQFSGNESNSMCRYTSILNEEYSRQVEKCLTPNQIEILVNELVEERHWEILDATLRGIHKEETEDRLDCKAVVAKLIEERAERASAVWRILVRVGEFRPEFLHVAIDAAQSCLQDIQSWQVAISAAQVVMQVSQFSGQYSEACRVLQIVSEVWKRLNELDGPENDTDHQLQFAAALTATIVTRHLELIEGISSDARNLFVDYFLHATFKYKTAFNVWNDMMKSPQFFECVSWKKAVLSALISNLEPYASLASDMNAAIQHVTPTFIDASQKERISLILSSIMKYPPETLKRSTREQILDICLLMEAAGHLGTHLLVDRLWRVGNIGSYMAINPTALANYCNTSEGCAVARRIIRYACTNKEQSKIRSYLLGLFSIVRDSKVNHEWQVGFTVIIITELWRLRGDGEMNQNLVFEKTRERFLKFLEKGILTGANLSDSYLKAWRDMWMLQRDDRQRALDLVSHISGHIVSGKLHDYSSVIEGLKIIFVVSEELEEMVRATTLCIFVHENLQNEVERTLLESYGSMIARLDIGAHLELLKRLSNGCVSDELSKSSWELLRVLIDSLKSIYSFPIQNFIIWNSMLIFIEPQPNSSDIEIVTPFYIRLLRELHSSHSAATFLYSAATINFILLNKPWLITQYTIDQTIAALAITASPSGPILEDGAAKELFTAITKILSSILTLHRHRIRGRYHLVVVLLQRLGNCLFSPKITRRKNDGSIHPPWLSLKTMISIDVHCAHEFSRVLEVFCDPPVSTVRNHKSDLIESERSRERKTVSAAVGPLIEWYVKRVLEDSIEISVRRELVIGIKKVLGVLGHDGLGRVSDRISAEGRSIVRNLWSEYGRNIRERV
ncbi:Urb2/Npa2 family-domain-containing protein [Geopyxis carbonaria]|nr:Urb2/Npa2 family-domain-containing protein [Geopyxis carbonaria]